MTTQAQIDAAAEAIRKYMGVFTDAEVIAKAAITAAAEVWPQDEYDYMAYETAVVETIERCAQVAVDNQYDHPLTIANKIRALKDKP